MPGSCLHRAECSHPGAIWVRGQGIAGVVMRDNAAAATANVLVVTTGAWCWWVGGALPP